MGAWGSGKTSFINLTRGHFGRSGVAILDFNPWMFSGAQQLVESFFVELSAQLKIRPDLAEVGKDLEEYGETFSGMAWLPLVGPWIERTQGAAKILGTLLQRRKEGVGGRRVKLEKALAQLNKPIVVVLDDIDRLSTSEIRDVFKLVRLTASFPNVIYIVAFDRKRVEGALAEEGVPGRAYLEKILQVAVDLPSIPNQVLNQQILSAVDGALATIQNPGLLDEHVWPDVFMDIIRPLIRNMRDVRRYAIAIQGTVEDLDGRIALADVLSLEAIRVFLPDVFARLHGAVNALTATSNGWNDRESPEEKAQIDSLLSAAEEHSSVARAMIEHLFPAGRRHIGSSRYGSDRKNRWQRERRVAHEDLLRLYLERVVGEGLQAFTDAERAWALMADGADLEAYLRSLDPTRLEDVIASLEAYEDQFQPRHVVPGTSVLLNLLQEIPERQLGLFDFGPTLTVTRVTYRLLKSLGDTNAVEAAVREILPELNSLSARLELLNEVGHRESRGHKLVSEVAAAEFERKWRDQVRTSSADDLAKEANLFMVLLIASRDADQTEPKLRLNDVPHLTLAILKSARSEVRSQVGRTVRRSPRLPWEELIELYGDEETLKRQIESLKAIGNKNAEELVKLAEKYLNGVPPNDWLA